MALKHFLLVAAFAAGAFNSSALTTSFSGQSGFTVSDTVGGITVDLTTSSPGYYGTGFFQYAATLISTGNASYTLSFSQAITNLSFDIVFINAGSSESASNFKVDGATASISAAPAIHTVFSVQGLADWDGATLSVSEGQYLYGARMNFSESSITSVTFDSSAVYSPNHWVIFDNFSFDEAVVEAVPDSGQSLFLLTPALLALAAVARRRR